MKSTITDTQSGRLEDVHLTMLESFKAPINTGPRLLEIRDDIHVDLFT